MMLADNLRKIRKEHKLTQKNIADALGIDRTTYTFYELGTTTPSPATLYKLSQIYRVSVGYLMGVEENNPKQKKESKADSVSCETDIFPYIEKDERELLMCFRILDDETKEKILDSIKEYAKQSKNEI